MKLIVGLGNIGDEYNNTRHNIGFMCLDEYAKENKFVFRNKFNALMYKGIFFNEQVIFIKPTTYMNLSGEAVKKFMDFYTIQLKDLLIIQDDLDLPFGEIRLKKNSSSGGQNGIKSIINHLNSQDFIRLKVGITNEYKRDVKIFVLSKFSKIEQKKLPEIYQCSNQIITEFIKGSEFNILTNQLAQIKNK